MLTRNDIDDIIRKAQQLNGGDKLRRAILDKAGAWLDPQTPEKDKGKIERELMKLNRRLAY